MTEILPVTLLMVHIQLLPSRVKSDLEVIQYCSSISAPWTLIHCVGILSFSILNWHKYRGCQFQSIV